MSIASKPATPNYIQKSPSEPSSSTHPTSANVSPSMKASSPTKLSAPKSSTSTTIPSSNSAKPSRSSGKSSRLSSTEKSPVRVVERKPSRSRMGNLIRKASSEFSFFVLRLKSLGDEVFNENQTIAELFEESDESVLDLIDKQARGYSANEEKFLLEYKKHRDLDKIYECNTMRNGSEEIKSSSTINSESWNGPRFSLKDVINDSISNTPIMENNKSSDEVEADEHDEHDDENNEHDEIHFKDIDVVQLKHQFDNEHVQGNVGEILWEYRRKKWVENTTGNVESTSRALFDQIPKDSYVKIYNHLIEKGRPLKSNRRINLNDLMKIVNAGWTAEEKWDRAARGLP